MSNRIDQLAQYGDDELRGIAAAAFGDHERSVSAEEIAAALRSVRSRIEAGDRGGNGLTITPASPGRASRSPWPAIASAAAAVVALVVGGLVVSLRGGDDDKLVPAVPPPASADPTTAPTPAPNDVTTSTPSVASPTTSPGTTIVAVPDPQTIGVDAADPASPPSTTGSADDGTLAIAHRCVGDEGNCTQLANTEDGRLVAYDPDGTLRVYEPTGAELQLEVPLAEPIGDWTASLIHVGPTTWSTCLSTHQAQSIRSLTSLPSP